MCLSLSYGGDLFINLTLRSLETFLVSMSNSRYEYKDINTYRNKISRHLKLLLCLSEHYELFDSL